MNPRKVEHVHHNPNSSTRYGTTVCTHNETVYEPEETGRRERVEIKKEQMEKGMPRCASRYKWALFNGMERGQTSGGLLFCGARCFVVRLFFWLVLDVLRREAQEHHPGHVDDGRQEDE